jgi:hypothetical protein
MFRARRDPGDGINKHNIYEVWGDVVEYAADAGPTVIRIIFDYLDNSGLAEYFNCEIVEAKQDRRAFLTLQWADMFVDIDARPFGEHLDVYAILALKRGLLDDPDPLARIADLEGWQRRDLQVLQTLIKQAMEEALIALDEGRV